SRRRRLGGCRVTERFRARLQQGRWRRALSFGVRSGAASAAPGVWGVGPMSTCKGRKGVGWGGAVGFLATLMTMWTVWVTFVIRVLTWMVNRGVWPGFTIHVAANAAPHPLR